jgi:hypothetical protein
MFKKLRDAFVTSQAVKRVAAHPQAFLAGSLAIEAFWMKNHEITKDFTPEFKEEQGRIWAGKVLEILESPDPLQKARSEIVRFVIALAPFQVLVLPSLPAVDESGLRGWLGISGELRQQLELVSSTDEPLATYLQSLGVPVNADTRWNGVLLRYRILGWCEHPQRIEEAAGRHSSGDRQRLVLAISCNSVRHCRVPFSH